MDLFSQNCPCCDSAKVDIRTRYTTQNNGTHSIYHCRSRDIYCPNALVDYGVNLATNTVQSSKFKVNFEF